MHTKTTHQSGFVSILTVLFLMVLLSVFVISFIKIVSDEQRQATDNDLAASALAAAQSGIEDGKRIVMYCANRASDAACTEVMRSGELPNGCDVFRNPSADMTSLRTSLGMELSSNGDVVVGDDSYRQAYTCLTINGLTDNITIGGNGVKEGRSTVRALNPLGTMSQIKLTWKGDSSVNYNISSPSTLFSPKYAWLPPAPAKPKPPVLRVQIIPYQAGNINLDDSEKNSRTLYIIPTNNSTVSPNSLVTDERAAVAGELRQNSTSPIVFAYCTSASGVTCQKSITGFTPGTSYYIRTTLIYSDASSLTIQAYDDRSQVLKFSSQPSIEATGRANDVFKRVSARVTAATPEYTAPEYALETSNTVCKNLVVTDDAASSSYDCETVTDNNNDSNGQPGIGGPPPGNPNLTPCWKAKNHTWYSPECWKSSSTNYTTFTGDSLRGCWYEWGDGKTTPSNASNTNYFHYNAATGTPVECKPGSVVPHDYQPPAAPSPLVGKKVKFIIVLHVLMKDGSWRTASRTIYLPR